MIGVEEVKDHGSRAKLMKLRCPIELGLNCER